MEGPFPNVYPLSNAGDDNESAPLSTPLRPILLIPPIRTDNLPESPAHLACLAFPVVARRSRLVLATLLPPPASTALAIFFIVLVDCR
jgi:hypothetical protein